MLNNHFHHNQTQQSFRFRKSIYLERLILGMIQTSLVLRGLNLNIHRGERIGLIGGTGSGKSTTVDLLMGLLEPTSGKLLVDGINVHDSNDPNLLLSWRASITHVPQNVYLIDATIAENIAFGVRCNDINFSRVTESAKKAQSSDFIEDLPLGYNTVVGENGIRLSGGQRQRIALARAFYKQSKVIILDEATSALDTETEKAVMASVDTLSKELTIVIIAHRISTLRGYDRIIKLVDGSIVADGPPHLILT